MSVVVHVYLFHRNQVMKVIDTTLFLYCEIFLGEARGGISVLFHFTNAGSMASAAESMSAWGKDEAEVMVAKLKRTNWVCYGLPCTCTLRRR